MFSPKFYLHSKSSQRQFSSISWIHGKWSESRYIIQASHFYQSIDIEDLQLRRKNFVFCSFSTGTDCISGLKLRYNVYSSDHLFICAAEEKAQSEPKNLSFCSIYSWYLALVLSVIEEEGYPMLLELMKIYRMTWFYTSEFMGNHRKCWFIILYC